METVIGKLDPKDYWEWRTTVTEMQLAQAQYDKELLKMGSIEKDLEIARLRAAIFKSSLEVPKLNAINAKSEYERFKKLLEDKLGQSLNECVIDDVTYEVKKLKE